MPIFNIKKYFAIIFFLLSQRLNLSVNICEFRPFIRGWWCFSESVFVVVVFRHEKKFLKVKKTCRARKSWWWWWWWSSFCGEFSFVFQICVFLRRYNFLRGLKKQDKKKVDKKERDIRSWELTTHRVCVYVIVCVVYIYVCRRRLKEAKSTKHQINNLGEYI